MMIIALGTVSGLLRERFWDYYGNGFKIITGTVSDYYGTVSDYYGMVSDYYENAFRTVWRRMGTICSDHARWA